MTEDRRVKIIDESLARLMTTDPEEYWRRVTEWHKSLPTISDKEREEFEREQAILRGEEPGARP